MRYLFLITSFFLFASNVFCQDEDKLNDIDTNKVKKQVLFPSIYTFTSSAIQAKKGDIIVSHNLYGPSLEYSLSNKFSLKIGTTWAVAPVFLKAKYQVYSNKRNLHFALQSIFASSSYLYKFRGYTGILNGVLTLGDTLNNISLSGGLGVFQTGELYSEANEGTYFVDTTVAWQIPNTGGRTEKPRNYFAPIFTISGMKSTGKKSAFICDIIFKFWKMDILESNFIYADDWQINPPLAWTNGDPGWSYNAVTEMYLENKFSLLVVSPGMRFSLKEYLVFQFTVGGALWTKNKVSKIYPVPSFSWIISY